MSALPVNIFQKLFGKAENGGETPEFKAFLNASVAGLQLQTDAHQNIWGLGRSERWSLSMDAGELVFNFPNMVARTPAQIIGTYDSADGSWLWAWANPSIPESLTRDARKVQDYGVEHQIHRLTARKWKAGESDGWQMTALACRLCAANGAYRGPAGSTFVFITFGEVQLSKVV